MKKQVFVCDKCGKESDISVSLVIPNEMGTYLRFWPYVSDEFDLCDECCEKLRNWLKGK